MSVIELAVISYSVIIGTSLKEQPDALIQLGSPLIYPAPDRIVKFSTEHRLPAISPFRSFVEAGGMMS